MHKLERLGISKYIGNFPIQRGRFKVECSDFVVHEMYQNEICTEKPKLDVSAVLRAHNFLIDLSACPEFVVHDPRVFKDISSEDDIMEMYNMQPACNVDGRKVQPETCGSDVLVNSECTKPKNTVSLHLYSRADSFCVGTYVCQDKKLRTTIHAALKPHPYVKTKTVGAAINFIFSKTNTYVFVVKKINRDTASVVSILSKKIGHVSFAGNKDKKAITYQRMSATTDFMKLYSCDVMDIRRGTAIKMGELSGNSFVIRVRDLQVRNVHELTFLNYFGNQRFGKGLNNHEVGKHIIGGRLDEALELVVKTYSENYEKDHAACVIVGECASEEGNTTSRGGERSTGAETVYSLYLRGEYQEAYLRIPPRFVVERHTVACRVKNLDPKLIVRSMRRESLMLYLHSYQSYLFNMNINKRLERGAKSSSNGVAGDAGENDYILKNGEFTAVSGASLEDVWLRMEKQPHPMCKGGFRKMVETANEFQAEVDGNDTIFRFWLRPCAFATMAIRELIGDCILP